jgi:hypothetical protein
MRRYRDRPNCPWQRFNNEDNPAPFVKVKGEGERGGRRGVEEM